MKNKPLTIIIPVKPGGRVTAVERLLAVLPEESGVEILIAEGACPSRQRNAAAGRAQAELLYFLDDDSLVSADFLPRLLAHFEGTQVAAVGGPSLSPVEDSVLQKSFAMIFSSIIGGGGMRNRYRRTGSVRETDDSELILCNLAFRKDVFAKLGGFDERLYPNEENELMERILTSGWKLVHDPELAVHRSHRPTLRAFVRQLFGYGRGRAEQTLLSRKVRLATLVPALFLMYVLSLLFTPLGVYSIPLLCYLLSTCILSVFDAFRGRNAVFLAYLPWLYPLFHGCYGAGFLWGLLSPRWKKKRVIPPVNIRVVRSLEL